MAEVKTDPDSYGWRGAPSVTIHVLPSNKRPIGFAAWPDPTPRKKRKKKNRG